MNGRYINGLRKRSYFERVLADANECGEGGGGSTTFSPASFASFCNSGLFIDCRRSVWLAGSS